MAAIRKRGNTYTITCSLGYDERGKQIRKFTTYTPPDGVTEGKAKKLAQEYAILWEDKIRGYVSLDENRTFRELAEWYYENVAPTILKESTLIHNQNVIDTYVLPAIGREKLKNITPQMLDSLFTRLQKSGRAKERFRLRDLSVIPKHKKARIARETGVARNTITRASFGKNIEREVGELIADWLGLKFDDIFVSGLERHELAAGTIRRVRRCTSAIFSSAVKKEIIRRNPVAHTEFIKREHTAESFLDEQQSEMLLRTLEAQPDFQFRLMITTLLFTGMHVGELCGLNWKNIDLDNGVIYIEDTLAYIMGNKKKGKPPYVLQPPKTASSKRYVKIPSSLLEMFKAHKREQDERREYFGSAWIPRNTVFCRDNGDFCGTQYVNGKFKTLAIRIGLPNDIHIHSLRHTTASILINAGVNAKAVADQLGHSRTTTTEDLYAHIFASSKVKTMQVLEMALMGQGK